MQKKTKQAKYTKIKIRKQKWYQKIAFFKIWKYQSQSILFRKLKMFSFSNIAYLFFHNIILKFNTNADGPL